MPCCRHAHTHGIAYLICHILCMKSRYNVAPYHMACNGGLCCGTISRLEAAAGCLGMLGVVTAVREPCQLQQLPPVRDVAGAPPDRFGRPGISDSSVHRLAWFRSGGHGPSACFEAVTLVLDVLTFVNWRSSKGQPRLGPWTCFAQLSRGMGLAPRLGLNASP